MSALRQLSTRHWRHSAFALAIVLSVVSDSRADAIAWQRDFEQARQLAAQQQKLVLVHVWAPWCGPCRRMDREVFNQPDLAAAIHTYYVPVKINTDQIPSAKHAFGIRAWPTDIVMTPDGKVIKKLEGFRTAAQYGELMAQIAGGTRPNIPQLVTRPVAPPVMRQQPAPAPNAQHPNQPAPRSAARNQPAPNAQAQRERQPVPNAEARREPQPAPRKTAQQPNPSRRPAPRVAGNSREERYKEFHPEQHRYRSEPRSAREPVAPEPARRPLPNQTEREQPPLPNRPHGNGRPPVEKRPQVARRPARGSQAGPPAPNAPEPRPVARNPNLPDLGLEGYCPVRLIQDKSWVLGNPQWGVIHRGKLYLFSGPSEKTRFFADPDHYAPVASGKDAVMLLEHGRKIDGKRELGVFGKDGRIYLFADEETLRKFQSNPEKYQAEVVESRLYKR